MLKGPGRLWSDRFVIVVVTLMWIVCAAVVVNDLVANGPRASASSRHPGAGGSNLGALFLLLVFAPVGAYWAFRNWNRKTDVQGAPKAHRRRRR